ncbi:putative 2OG-Fe(II) oxygenase [Candidatus Pelagibacter sp.]|uniref:putative 2OG-Fe(II) oxygenase n=1 Tax=Candidatus Pelagibacter sp. TaxID=2024849 RepID=UPI003F847A19
MDKEKDFEIIKQFGPSILKVKIPNEILNQLNEYIDNIVEDKELSKKLNFGEQLVGDVSQEIKLETEIMQKSGWGNFLGLSVGKWIGSEMGKKITKFNIIESWAVRQFKNEYNPVHWHNGHISGAGFLKVPKIFGKHVQNKENKNYKGGNLQLIHGSRMFLNDSTYTIKPKVGDFYFFPNYMMHVVYPFKESDEERRSISFNAKIDDEIFNVYG